MAPFNSALRKPFRQRSKILFHLFPYNWVLGVRLTWWRRYRQIYTKTRVRDEHIVKNIVGVAYPSDLASGER